MESNKLTGIYCVIVGIIIVFTWIMLLTTGQVANLEEELLSFLFHWTSEFIMAGLNILAGWFILKDKGSMTKLYFFATGMLFIAVIGMFFFYLVYFDITFVIMGGAFSIITLLLAVRNFKTIKDFIHLTIGVVFYAQLNIMGDSLQRGNFGIFLYNLMAFIPILIITYMILLKESEQEIL